MSTALPTRARPSFSQCCFLPSGSSHKPPSLLHQRADRRSKKNHNPTVARTKTTIQKVNQDEMHNAPDEGKIKPPEKLNEVEIGKLPEKKNSE